MTGCSRWAAGCLGFFLLLPGLCFFFGGLARVFKTTEMFEWTVFGALLLGGAGWLIYSAFRAPDVIKPQAEEPPKTE